MIVRHLATLLLGVLTAGATLKLAACAVDPNPPNPHGQQPEPAHPEPQQPEPLDRADAGAPDAAEEAP